MTKIKPKNKPHYVNNREFSYSVVDYVKKVNAAQDSGEALPIVPDYIAECFLKISEGLSHKSNFIRYTYREEMVMDAVENCLKAITNYDKKSSTPAFSIHLNLMSCCFFSLAIRLKNA